MKENWTKQMKNKLEGHQMTPPAELWEGISNQMGLESASVPPSAVIRRWHWAVAAVVLALVGFFAFYNFDDEEPKLEVKSETAIKPSIPEDKPMIAEESTTPEETIMPVVPSKKPKPSLLAMTETQQMIIEDTNDQESVGEKPVPSVDEQKEQPQTELQHKKQTYLPDVIESTTTASYSESSSKWTIGLAGSNGLLFATNNYVNTTAWQALYNDANPADYYTMGNLAHAYTYTDVESKHHIPLRLGLSLQYQFSERLALLSGISYTYLKSEFIYPQHSHYNFDQKLSYLGIPIGLSWKMWSTEHFNVYLTGGTMLEKCVSAEVSEGELDSRPWQWSVNAAVGAEYNVTRQFGVYLEPSLGYYFDDRSKLEHYYKEHPLAPSLQFGVRLHLK